MKKYYKIPMTMRIVKANGITLFQTLQEHYPDLYNREQGRIEITYGEDESAVITPQLDATINEYNAQTQELYKTIGVPQYIIGFKNEDEDIVEFVTKTPLTTDALGSFLDRSIITQKEAYAYLDEERNYIEVVNKLFLKKDKPKSFGKRLVETITGSKDN